MSLDKSALFSAFVSLLGLIAIHEPARADEWKPTFIIMPRIEYADMGLPCELVDTKKKRIYLSEWGKPPYVLIGEEADISPKWSGSTGRSILIKLRNGNEVFIDKACISPNPLFNYQKSSE